MSATAEITDDSAASGVREFPSFTGLLSKDSKEIEKKNFEAEECQKLVENKYSQGQMRAGI